MGKNMPSNVVANFNQNNTGFVGPAPQAGRQDEIRLIARGAQADQEAVRFYVTPDLSESRTVNYQEISEMRQAGGLLIYIGTGARTYQLNAKMVSRTAEEADLTFIYTHRLKSWTVPNKLGADGKTGLQNVGVGQSRTGGENAPEVLKLWGYGDTRQLRGVPVVITSLNIEYPSNVSYIRGTGATKFVPIIQTFSIGLKEARNMDELEAFDMVAYKQGILPYW